MIALTLLSLVVSSLAALSWRVGQRQRDNRARTYRTAALTQLANRVSSIPYDSLSQVVGSQTVSGVFPHTQRVRRVTVSSGGATYDSLFATITPTDALVRVDSVIIVRAPTICNPLAGTC